MLWVVIGHAGPSPSLDDYPTYALFLHDFAYSFHMPLFIAISGFLFYLTRLDSDKWTYVTTMKEKLVRFGIPFLVFTFVALLLKSAFSGAVDRGTSLSINEYIKAILVPYDGPMREFWFLAAIMWFFALYPLWKFATKNKWVALLLLVLLLLMAVWYPKTNFLAIQSVCTKAIYFYLGLLCAVYYKKSPDFINKKFFLIGSLCVGIVVYLMGRIWNVPFLSPLGGAAFSLSLAIILDKVFSKCFSGFRNYTYQIYLLGIFFQVLLSIIRRRYGLPFTPIFILNIFTGLYAPVLISKLFEWINWRPLLLCVGLKKKNK